MGSERKLKFAPIPIRACGDRRLTARHFRVLAAVAMHDMLGKRHGCIAGRKRLSALTQCNETHVSDALGDLRLWGYISSETHPMNRRTKIHRVIYDLADSQRSSDRSQKQDRSLDQDRSSADTEKVPSQKAKPLTSSNNVLSNIFYEDIRRKSGLAENELQMTPDYATSYLSEVRLRLASSDRSIREAVRCELPILEAIINEDSLPYSFRTEASELRSTIRIVFDLAPAPTRF